MRLTLATAVVASRAAAVSASAAENDREAATTTATSFVNYDQEERRRQRLLLVGNDNVGRNSQTASKRSLLPNHGQRRRRKTKGGVDPSFPPTNGILNKLMDSAAEEDEDMNKNAKECDPSIDHTNSDNSRQDLLGVLSCGLKKYCQESEGSSLGGFCIDKTKHETKNDDGETKPENNPYPQQLVRRRQQVVGRLSVLELADLFCNRPEATELTVDCDCSNMDFENGNGTLSCYFGPDCIDLETGCADDGSGGLVNGGGSDLSRNGDTFEHCTTEKFDANITSETLYEYTSCYTQRMPRTDYSFTYCTDFAFNVIDGPTCDIEVEGEKCNSCGIAIGGGVDYAENCEVFDCTNTFLNYAGDRCGAFSNPSLRSASIVEYLYESFWPCSNGGCNLCGEGGRMTQGYANFTYTTQFLNVTDLFYCYDVNYQAVTGGLYGTSYCETLPEVVREVCGCVALPTALPVDTPADSPPTGAPPAPPPDQTEIPVAPTNAPSSAKSLQNNWSMRMMLPALGLLAIGSALWSVA